MNKSILLIGLLSLSLLVAQESEIPYREEGESEIPYREEGESEIPYREEGIQGVSIDGEQMFQGVKKIFDKGPLSFINAENGWQITQENFEKPIVSVIVKHESINDTEQYFQFYQDLSQLLFESGANIFPDYDFAIINALEVKEISQNFQLEQFHPDRNFFLAILRNKDVGFLYDGPIINEGKTLTIELEAGKVVTKFIKDFRDNKLQPYLKTETSDPTPVIIYSILRVYGSNFISLVKDRKFDTSGTMKALILVFKKQNCTLCDETESNLAYLSQEFGEEDFQYAIMDIDKNSPTYDIKQFFNAQNQPMLQLLAVLPDGASVKRFYKEGDTYEDLQNFMESFKFLLLHQRKEAELNNGDRKEADLNDGDL